MISNGRRKLYSFLSSVDFKWVFDKSKTLVTKVLKKIQQLQSAVSTTTSLFLTSVFEILFKIFLFHQQLAQQTSVFWLPFSKSYFQFSSSTTPPVSSFFCAGPFNFFTLCCVYFVSLMRENKCFQFNSIQFNSWWSMLSKVQTNVLSPHDSLEDFASSPDPPRCALRLSFCFFFVLFFNI